MAEEVKLPDVDLVDILSIGTVMVVTGATFASTGGLFIALPLLVGHWIQHKARRTQGFKNLIDDSPSVVSPITRRLLPPERNDESTSISVTNNNYGTQTTQIATGDDRPLWQRVVNPDIGDTTTSAAQLIKNTSDSAKQLGSLLASIKKLPKYLSYKNLPNSPSKLSVPVGYDADTKQIIWADFDSNTIHAIIAGYTGSGKDALLRLWFTILTLNNTPDEVKFVFIDGKGDWLVPALQDSAYMAIPPVGGTNIQRVNKKLVNCAIEQMKESLFWVFDELERRKEEFHKYGAVDTKSYERRAKKKLPTLFFIATDVGETFDDDLNLLINYLSARGRAYGVRMIVSMQNPVGEKTKWKSQVGLVMTGHQPNPDHDRIILGINVPVMRFRPSQLPNPEENDLSKGLFIVRRGSSQLLVRTFHLPEIDWEQYTENVMKRKSEANDDLLLSLYENKLPDVKARPYNTPVSLQEGRRETETTKVILSKDKAELIALWASQGVNKTEIMARLKATNPERYKAVSPIVDKIMERVREANKS